MLYPNYRWVDVAFGGANKRNNLVNITKLKAPNVPDCYRTVYRYPDAMREHFAKNGTVSGYRGYVYADWLPVDIDDKDINAAHMTARKALMKLLESFEVNLGELKCFFSGSKGFHILIPAVMFGLKPDKKLPQVFSRMAGWLFEGISYDAKIYDVVRLFRLANTVNSKSGLYKIPLTAAEILHESVEKILEWAKKPRQISFVSEKDVALNEVLHELYQKALDEVNKPVDSYTIEGNGAKRNGKIKPCIAKILEGVEKGDRNNTALRLAVHYAKEGLPQDMLLAALIAWNKRNIPPLPEKELEVVAREAVEKPYDFGCNDEVLKEYCSQPCPVKKNGMVQEEETLKILTVADAQNAYLEYIESLRKARVTLGFGALDEKMRGIAPGEVCQIIARSAVGKTTFLLNVLRNISLGGVRPVVFCTMEMPLAQVFERMCQIAAGAGGSEVERAARKFLFEEGQEYPLIAEKTMTTYQNVYFVENDGLSLEQLEEIHGSVEQMTGEKVRVIALDYMGRMRAGHGTPYEVTSRLAKGLKYLAKKLKVAVISLHQTSREGGGDGTEPVTIQSARDSGAVEEAADFIIGMWRPDKKESRNATEERVQVALLKNRRGNEVWTEITFYKPTLRMLDNDLSDLGTEIPAPLDLPWGRDEAAWTN